MAVRSEERTRMLADVVISVAEDGCTNSWRQVIDYKWSDEDPASTYVEIVDICDDEDGSTPTFKFDIEAAAKGLRLLVSGEIPVNGTIKGECVSTDLENECYLDAYSADCVLQAAWFGELVYG